MMKITGLSHLFKWENLHNWWLTKYFFAPLYIIKSLQKCEGCAHFCEILYKYILYVCVFILGVGID